MTRGAPAGERKASAVELIPVVGVPLVEAGDDLPGLIVEACTASIRLGTSSPSPIGATSDGARRSVREIVRVVRRNPRIANEIPHTAHEIPHRRCPDRP